MPLTDTEIQFATVALLKNLADEACWAVLQKLLGALYLRVFIIFCQNCLRLLLVGPMRVHHQMVRISNILDYFVAYVTIQWWHVSPDGLCQRKSFLNGIRRKFEFKE